MCNASTRIAQRRWTRTLDDRLGRSNAELERRNGLPERPLPAEERFKINEHIVETILMLKRLPFPPDLTGVPEIAGGHHETRMAKGIRAAWVQRR